MGFGVCYDGTDRNIHETGIARIDFVNDRNGDLFYVLLIFFSIFLLMVIDLRNRYRFQSSDGQSGGAYVILPGYFGFLTTVAAVNIVFGMILLFAYIFDGSFGRWMMLSVISLQFGVSHLFYETPTFFFLCNGGGHRDFVKAVRGGGSVGLLAFLFLFVAGYYGILENCYQTPFYIFICFRFLIIGLYAFIVFAPNAVLYRRPALTPYSRFMLLYNLMWLFVNFSLFFGPDYFYCSAYIINFVFDGLMPPLIIYYAFVVDSQYWQGCLPLPNNPLSGMWDVNSEVVSAMASSISQPSAFSEQNVPVIHYGMINIDMKMGFHSGGFSRVYSAEYRQRRVAVKLLFAMELTPESIVMFYKEAQILKDLQSEYVVECLGITLMPPAIGVVMEYCQNGSLFDFLYAVKNSTSEMPTTRGDFATDQDGGLRLTLVGHHRTETPHTSDGFRTAQSTMSSFSIANNSTHSFDDSNMRASGAYNLSFSPITRIFSDSFVSRPPSVVSSGRNSNMLAILAGHAHTVKYDMMLDAASGLAFMHSKGYMHCDIKSLNYLVTTDLRLKLSDLGEARRITADVGVGGAASETSAEPVETSRRCPCPAVNWCPPECLLPDRTYNTYTPASDVFSLSMVLSEIMLHALPLEGALPQIGYFEWHQLIVDKNLRPFLPVDCPIPLQQILEAGWNTAPKLRPEAYEIVQCLKQVIIDMKRMSGRTLPSAVNDV